MLSQRIADDLRNHRGEWGVVEKVKLNTDDQELNVRGAIRLMNIADWIRSGVDPSFAPNGHFQSVVMTEEDDYTTIFARYSPDGLPVLDAKERTEVFEKFISDSPFLVDGKVTEVTPVICCSEDGTRNDVFLVSPYEDIVTLGLGVSVPAVEDLLRVMNEITGSTWSVKCFIPPKSVLSKKD